MRRPLVPVLLPALERRGQFDLGARTRELVLDVGAATIDRLLTGVRLVASGGRRRRAGFSSAVRRTVPVRTFSGWADPALGYLEADFVAHGGAPAAGPLGAA